MFLTWLGQTHVNGWPCDSAFQNGDSFEIISPPMSRVLHGVATNLLKIGNNNNNNTMWQLEFHWIIEYTSNRKITRHFSQVQSKRKVHDFGSSYILLNIKFHE